MEHIVHAFGPVYDEHSRVLVLGIMPSPASRQQGFYYGHPRNRFWPVLAALFGEETPPGPDERRGLALAHGVALWDVLSACDIEGASDSSIREPVPNDIGLVLRAAPIRAVFTTGARASELYARLCLPETGVAAVPLPSTSPANARMGFAELLERYRVILQYTEP